MGILGKIFKIGRKILNVVTMGASNFLWRKFKKWMQPDLPEKEGLKVARKGSDHPIPVVYGQRIVGGIIVDQNSMDVPNGLWNEVLHLLVVFSHGEIDSFVEFFFDGVSWNDKRFRKDPENPNSAKWFTYELRTGADNQTAMNGVGKFNRFDADSKYEGLACAIFTFTLDPDMEVFKGVPQITAHIKGKKCYDPRTGLTTYTENGALHLLDYCKNPVYGKGIPDDFISIASFTAVANICDASQTATVDTRICQTVNGVYTCTGSPAETVTFKRFTHNNIIDTERRFFDNMQEIANSFRGYFPDFDGRVTIASEKEENSVFSFNEDLIIGGITSSVPGRDSRYNRVIIRFPNIANKFEMDEVCYPEAGSALYTTWLAEDNGLTQEKTITYESVVYKAEALQLARLIAVVSRNSEYVSFKAASTSMQCDVGDVVSISNATRGWTNRLFRISKMTYNDDDTVSFEAIQHDNNVYPWVSPTYSEIVGGSNLGDPSSIPAPTGLTLTYDTTLATTGTVKWNTIPSAFVTGYVVTILSGTTEVFKSLVTSEAYVIPKLDVGNYSVQVKAKTSIGTFGATATIAFSLTIPVAPTDINFTVGNFDIEARPVLAGIGLGTEFEFAIGDTNTVRGRGMTMIFTSLTPSTAYTIYARAVNAYGVSAWFSKSTSTNLDQAKLNPFLTSINNQLNQLNTVELVAVKNNVTALQNKFPLTGTDIAANAIDSSKIVAAAITSGLIADLAVNSAKIAANAITTSKVAADAITATQIAANAVTTVKIADAAILTAKLADNAITTAKVAAGAINSTLLADLAVTAAKVADAAITTNKIAANAVSSTHLADLAVTASKVADAAITTNKIVAGAINSTLLADLAVTANKVAANAITVNAIADGAVVASKINAQIGGGNLVRNAKFNASAYWGPYNNGGNPLSRYDTGRTLSSRSFVTTQGTPAGSTLGVFGAAVKGGWRTETWYIVSFYMRKTPSSTASGAWLFWNDGPQSLSAISNPTLSTSWQRYVFKIRWTNGSSVPNSADFGLIWITATGFSSTDEIWVCDVQVEEGELLTAFAPCPDEILPSSITTTEIADNAITSPKIIAGAITAGKIAANSISATEIIANSLTGNQLAFRSITGWNIAADTITAVNISANNINSAHLQAGSVIAGKIASRSITAAEIFANTITANEIAFGTITGDRIAANTITANKIASNSITADQIAGQSIVGWNIAAYTITAANIATNTITADQIAGNSIIGWNIAGNTITAGHLQAGSITAGKIAAGAVTANEIAAGAISATKLTITGGGVINLDPMLQDPDAWWGSGGASGAGYYAIMSTSQAPVGTQVIATTLPTTVFLNEKFYHAIDTTKRYRVRFWARKDANANGILYFSLRQFKDRFGTHCDINGGRSPYKPSGVTPPTTWTEYSFEWAGPDWQAEMKYVQMEWLLNYGGSSGYMEICYPRLEEMAPADLIVDGAISTSKLAAGAVTAATIAAGAVTAGKISANAISSAEIQAGAITAGKIAAGSITSNEIAAGSITANRLTLTSIGDTVNLDPGLYDMSAWSFSSPNIFRQTSPGGAGVGQYYATCTNGTDNLVESAFFFPIDPNKTYNLSAMLFTGWGNTRNMYIFINFYVQEYGQQLGTGWGGTMSGYTYGGTPPVGDWSRQGGQFGAGTDLYKIPANAKVCKIGVWMQYSGSGSSQVQQACSDIRLVECITANLIVDGQVSANKLAAEAVTASKIAAGVITADKIAANTISGNNIAGYTITGWNIAGNTISGDKIIANQITAAHIQAGTITADKLYSNAIDVAILSAGGIDVTNGGYQLRLLTADKPIELKQGGVTTFSVNPDGSGYYKGGLGDNTVGINAITTEARRAINPFYAGYAESKAYATPSNISAGTAPQLAAFTSLVAKDKVAISFRFADSFESFSGATYGTSSYRAQVQRNDGSGWVNVPNGTKDFNIQGFSVPARPWPEYEPYRSGYYYDAQLTVTDDIPTTSGSISYRVLLTLLSAGANTAGGALLQQFTAEKSGFIKNQFANDGTVMKFVDKETGFTVICGSATVSSDSNTTVYYNHTLTAVISAFAQRDFSGYGDWTSGAIAAFNSSATLYNQFTTGSIKWCVLGFTAV